MEERENSVPLLLASDSFELFKIRCAAVTALDIICQTCDSSVVLDEVVAECDVNKVSVSEVFLMRR